MDFYYLPYEAQTIGLQERARVSITIYMPQCNAVPWQASITTPRKRILCYMPRVATSRKSTVYLTIYIVLGLSPAQLLRN